MIEASLFLGFICDPLFESGLEKATPYWVELLTGGGDYLSKVTVSNVKYLGKFASSLVSLEELENLESNILSLLKRLVPDYPFRTNVPVLLTLPKPQV